MNPLTLTLDDILLDLPDLALAQLAEAFGRDATSCPGPERRIEPRKGSSVIRVRAALLELARAIYGYDHHLHTQERPRTELCGPAKLDANGEPEWRMACAHLLRLWEAREEYELACINAPEDASGCKCHGSGVFTGRKTSGVCYGCEGKGWMSPADVKRCNYYWNHACGTAWAQ